MEIPEGPALNADPFVDLPVEVVVEIPEEPAMFEDENAESVDGDESDIDSACAKLVFFHGDSDSTLESCNGEDSVCSSCDLGYDGWNSSSSSDQDEGAAGYIVDFDAINQDNLAWEEWVIATRTSQLMHEALMEWHWFYSHWLDDRLWQISHGYSTKGRHNWPRGCM